MFIHVEAMVQRCTLTNEALQFIIYINLTINYYTKCVFLVQYFEILFS